MLGFFYECKKKLGFCFFLKYAKFLHLNISLAPLPFSNNLINEFVIEGEKWMNGSK